MIALKNVDTLDALGEDGWELVAIDSDRHAAYLKRPITEDT
jgi:hypothetical protein